MRLLPALLGGLLVLTGCSTASTEKDTEAAAAPPATSDGSPASTHSPTADAPSTHAPSTHAPSTHAPPTQAPSAQAPAPDDAPTSTEAETRRPQDPVNLLLVGSDSRDPASVTGNADSIVLVHLPADRSGLGLVSFTRDMWVSVPGAGEAKINAALPMGGTPLLTETVSDLLGGLDVDHTVQVSMDALPELTGWLGGIEVVNQHPSEIVDATGRRIVFEQGPIRLEADEVLHFVRQRQGMPRGDLDRAERQRAVLVGLMGRLQGRVAEEPGALLELLPLVRDAVHLDADTRLEDLLALVPLLVDLDREDTYSLMVPLGGFDTIGGQSVNIVDRGRTAALGQALRDDDLPGYVERHGAGSVP